MFTNQKVKILCVVERAKQYLFSKDSDVPDTMFFLLLDMLCNSLKLIIWFGFRS